LKARVFEPSDWLKTVDNLPIRLNPQAPLLVVSGRISPRGHIRQFTETDVLRVDYLSVPGLPNLSFEVVEGECLAIEGPSGSGKTRLLRAIADLDPVPGYVHLDGIERGEMTGPAWRRQVRYASAEPAWWAATGRDHFSASVRLERLLSALALDIAHLDRPIATLSTGERQRLGLVRALADEPRVLLLDEPTSTLDATSAAMAEELIRFQLLAGRIVLVVSHDAAQIERLAHARLQLADNRASHTSRGEAA
jgi:ABC-type multidrug transport system ATPase subunit